MKAIKNIRIEDYSYNLPQERIAKYPEKQRDNSKLLIYDKGHISETSFKNIPGLLSENELIIFNNTKVIQARLEFYKDTGAKIEIFCLEPHIPADYSLVFEAKKKCTWKCLVGNLKKWKTGKIFHEINFNGNKITVNAEKSEKQTDNSILINFSWNTGKISFGEILEKAGNTPIPPYLNRKSEEIDKKSYQTVYSEYKGSVAAPTAGLHFTENIINEIQKKGCSTDFVTLHVGAGTFRPVKSKIISDHSMHTEHFTVSLETIRNLKKHAGKIIAVGTTSVRTLESIYHLGNKFFNKDFKPEISQWECYENPTKISFETALNEIEKYIDKQENKILEAKTKIMIAPGYKFRVVNKIITNFHQPQSTLLLLISAFVGNENWRKIYDYALKNNFRFLSYGDSSILKI